MDLDFKKWPTTLEMLTLFIGTMWILALGTLDDKSPLGWSSKLLGLILGAIMLILGGHSFGTVTVPFYGPVQSDWWGTVLFVLAVVTIANAINFIDGIDGLAGGICFFVAMTSGIIGFAKGDSFTALIALTVAGSLFGFMVFNYPPASVFMGDGGSLTLGFLLGTLATSSAALYPGQRFGTMASILIPMLLFALPLSDLAVSSLRRWFWGQSPFKGDRDHIHHRVLRFTNNPRLTLAIFYCLTAYSCILTLIFILYPSSQSAVQLTSVGTIVLIGVGLIGVCRLYPIEHLPTAIRNRPHYKYLVKYVRLMRSRIREASSTQELVDLLGTGVAELGFDYVRVRFNGDWAREWTNRFPLHPGGLRTLAERSLDSGRLIVEWSHPVHDEDTYNRYIGLTWQEVLSKLEHALMHSPRELSADSSTLALRTKESGALWNAGSLSREKEESPILLGR